MSADWVTVVVSVSELLAGSGSVSVAVTDVVFVRVAPFGVAGLTLTTNVKTWAPSATVSVVFVAETVPVPPAGGVTVVQPAGAVNDINVVLAGTRSVKLTLLALTVPRFCTVMVYVRFEPALTGSGESVFVTERSAP